jgi:hypothetical protein
MSKERANTAILMGNRETIRYLKNNNFMMGSSGDFPHMYDLSIEQESEYGVKIYFHTWKGIGVAFLKSLAESFPDLYIRADYNYHNSDGCLEGYWIAETVDGEVKVTEALLNRKLEGCCGLDVAPLWHKLGKKLIIDGVKTIEFESDNEVEILDEVIKYFDKKIMEEKYTEFYERRFEDARKQRCELLKEVYEPLPSRQRPHSPIVLNESDSELPPVPIPKKKTVVKKKIIQEK